MSSGQSLAIANLVTHIAKKTFRFTYKLLILLILAQVILFIVGGTIFGLYKDEIHQKLESTLGKDLFQGDSLRIGELDYRSTLLLSPQLSLDEVQIWGQGARHLTPAFDVEQMIITLSWREIFSMLWEASQWSLKRPFFTIKNERVRVRLNGMRIVNGTLTMTRTDEGHNHRLFRPPLEKIQKFASGELKMAGGFRIKKFEAINFHLNYYKNKSGNPDEALPKKYDVLFDKITMDMSSDSTRAYFDDFYAEGTINSILVAQNEGLVGRVFKADGDAQLVKLSLEQKLNNDTGFDLVSENFNVTFKDLQTTARGILSTLNERLRMDIDFQSKTGLEDRKNEALLSFLELTLSDRFLDIIKSYNPLGELTFIGKVFNRDNEYGGAIKIDLDYVATNTSFEFQFFENGKNHVIRDLELAGEFEVGGESPSYITADITHGELYDGQQFEGRVVLDNVFRREFLDSLEQLEQPPLAEVQFHSQNVDFHRLLEFLEFEQFDQAEGTIDFNNFHFSGPIASLSKSYMALNYGGTLRFKDILFESSKLGLPVPLKVEKTTGSIAFSRNSVRPKMSFTLNQHPVTIQSGIIRDFVPYIFNEDRDRLFLEDFRMELGAIEASSLLEEIKELGEAEAPQVSTDLATNLLTRITQNLKIQDMQVVVPEVDGNNLYQIEGLDAKFPQIDPLYVHSTLDIDDEIKLVLFQRSGADDMVLDVSARQQGEELVVKSDLELNVQDLNDFGCKIGFNLPLGTHLSSPLAIAAKLQLESKLAMDKMSLDLDGSGTRIYNDELNVDLQFSKLAGKTDLIDLKLTPPLQFDLGVLLDDESVEAQLSMTTDSLLLTTLDKQVLSFEVAKKYLSLICEIDQNLARLENLEGTMTFDTSIKERRGASGIDMILEADQQGSFEIDGLSFDYRKGDNNTISFRDVRGEMTYDQEVVHIKEFHGNYEQSDFEIYDTEVDDLIGFILLGEPLMVDTLHLHSRLLDLTSILESNAEFHYTCQEDITLTYTPEETCTKCLIFDTSDTSNAVVTEPIAFSLLNFLQTSTVKHAEAYVDRILFSPISGSDPFEIDNLNVSANLDSSILTLTDLQATMYDGLLHQYEPLKVWVKNADTLALTGAYTVKDLELHEVIEKLNDPAVEPLNTDQLDFRGKLSMDFDFVDTLTRFTDLNTLEFRINNMRIVDGSAKELTRIGMEKKWKENVGPLKRFLAGVFLGSF